jgi:hypothetical protein
MSSIVISGDTSGTITLAAPAVAGSNTLTLPLATDTLAGIAATQTLTNKTLTSPTLTAPALGTVSSGVLTACTAATAASGTNTTALATTAFAYGTLSAAASGYTKLANGLIIQWGSASVVGVGGTAAVTFPVTFTTRYSLTLGNLAGVSYTYQNTAGSVTTSGFTMYGGGTLTSNWIAIGV